MSRAPAQREQLARPLARGFMSLAITRAGTLAMQFAALALMAAHLHPRQLGIYIFALAFAGIFTLVTDFGFQATVAREVAQDPAAESSLLPNLAYLRLAMAGLAYLLVVGALVVIGYGQATTTATLLAGLTLFIGAFDGFGVSLQVRVQVTAIGLGGLTQAAITLVGAALLTTTRAGVDAYILLTVAATLTNVVIVTGATVRKVDFQWRPRPSSWAPLARAALPLGVAGAAIALYYRLDLLILGRLKSVDAVGQYGAGYRFLEALNVLPALVVTMLGPVLARSVIGPREILQRRFRHAIHLAWLLALPIGLIGGMTAFRILPALPGFGQYRGAGRVLAILSPAGSFIILGTVLSTVLVSAGQQRRLLRVSLVVLVANVGLNLALIPPLSYSGAAIATVATEALVVGLSLVMIRRHVGIGWPRADLIRTLPAGVLVAAVLGVGYLTESFIQLGMGLAAFLICLLVTPALRLSDVPGLFVRSGPITFIAGRALPPTRVDELCAAWPNPEGGWRWIVIGHSEDTVTSLLPDDTPRLGSRHVVRLWRLIRGSSACVLLDLTGTRRRLAAWVAVAAGCRPVILADRARR